jgi:hypothetical protein
VTFTFQRDFQVPIKFQIMVPCFLNFHSSYNEMGDSQMGDVITKSSTSTKPSQDA